jgi:hypothetical protein
MAPAPIATSTMNGANGIPTHSKKKSADFRRRHGSIGQREAESHVPTLKNQGKSDCAVQIIGITDVKAGIPTDELSKSKNGSCKLSNYNATLKKISNIS